MLKSAAAFAIALVALSASASQAQTDISIYPNHPVTCAKHDYPIVNQVSRVTKVSETEKTVVFTFRTALGACVEGNYVLQIGMGNAVVQTLRNKIMIFGKEGVKSSIEVLSGSEAQIKLAFDKKTLFKKKNVATFTMGFYPNYIAPVIHTDAWGRRYYYQPHVYYFPWQVKVTQLENQESELEVGVLR